MSHGTAPGGTPISHVDAGDAPHVELGYSRTGRGARGHGTDIRYPGDRVAYTYTSPAEAEDSAGGDEHGYEYKRVKMAYYGLQYGMVGWDGIGWHRHGILPRYGRMITAATPSPHGTQTCMHSRERERERATPWSTLRRSGEQSCPAQPRELLRTSQSAERLARPSLCHATRRNCRTRVRIPSMQRRPSPYTETKPNGLDLDLERTNKRAAHAPHTIRTRKRLAEPPTRELACKDDGDAESLQRDAEGAVADEYEGKVERSGVGVDEETQEHGAGV
ncbi:hypothetical protein K438DRAFT_2070298 [Mycena galopus ATCC 62051]|nr:hypothetical protein K438DRAFT_2070298 [Mycena galopus ATCC 62051]